MKCYKYETTAGFIQAYVKEGIRLAKEYTDKRVYIAVADEYVPFAMQSLSRGSRSNLILVDTSLTTTINSGVLLYYSNRLLHTLHLSSDVITVMYMLHSGCVFRNQPDNECCKRNLEVCG